MRCDAKLHRCFSAYINALGFSSRIALPQAGFGDRDKGQSSHISVCPLQIHARAELDLQAWKQLALQNLHICRNSRARVRSAMAMARGTDEVKRALDLRLRLDLVVTPASAWRRLRQWLYGVEHDLGRMPDMAVLFKFLV